MVVLREKKLRLLGFVFASDRILRFEADLARDGLFAVEESACADALWVEKKVDVDFFRNEGFLERVGLVGFVEFPALGASLSKAPDEEVNSPRTLLILIGGGGMSW